jgi:hypothetical protein
MKAIAVQPICWLALISLVGVAPSVQSQVSYTTVVLNGQQAADLPSGVTHNSFDPPSLNNADEVAFSSQIKGTDVTPANGYGIWGGGRGSLDLVARKGDPAPLTGGEVFFDLVFDDFNTQQILGPLGATAFSSKLIGTGVNTTNDSGLWLGYPGATYPHLVAREGDHAVGTPSGVKYGEFFATPSVYNARPVFVDTVGFKVTLLGSGVLDTNDTGIWSGSVGALSLVARKGSQAADVAAGLKYTDFGNKLALNSEGEIAFYGQAHDSNRNGANGVWVGKPGELVAVALSGDTAPGTGGRKFAGASNPDINNEGEIAFTAYLDGGAPNNQGVWAGKPDSLELVARKGFGWSKRGGSLKFADFQDPVIGANGHVAFIGTLSGFGVTSANDTGIWVGKPGSLRLVAREGGAAPTGFTSDGKFKSFSGLSVNAAGQVAFQGTMVLGDPSNIVTGHWATDTTGKLRPVAIHASSGLSGTTIQVGRFDTREVNFAFQWLGSGGEDGRVNCLNDAGDVAFHTTFKGNTNGIIIGTVLVPSRTRFNLNGTGPHRSYLLFNPTDRKAKIWTLKFGGGGNELYLQGDGPTVTADWTLVGSDDFNHDGNSDYVIFRPATRQTKIWHILGTTVDSTLDGPTLPAGFTLASTDDFNLDTNIDYLLFNAATGQTQIWYLAGASVVGTESGPTVPAGWQVVGSDDFNRDGSPDLLLFKPATRETAIWYLNGATPISSPTSGPTATAGWKVVGSDDFNADGRPDLLLVKDATGETMIWYMENADLSASLAGPTLPAGYKLAAP